MGALTFQLRKEHLEIIKMLDRLQIATDRLRKNVSPQNLVEVELQLFEIKEFVEVDHHHKEEAVLFPAMFESGKISQGGPRCSFFMGLRMLKMKLTPITHMERTPLEQSCLSIPLAEHRECADLLNAAADLIVELKRNPSDLLLNRLVSNLELYQSTLRLHIDKEDTCLFVLADQVLDHQAQEQLRTTIDNDKLKRSKKMKVMIAALSLLISVGAQAKTIEVKMLNAGKDGTMVFEPGFVQAAPGDTVKFVPTNPSHSVTSVLVPAGAKSFAGKMDQAVTVKLDKEGVYVYQCDPHAIMAMVGVIQVGKATNLAEAKASADKLAPKFVMNKDRLTKYLANVK